MARKKAKKISSSSSILPILPNEIILEIFSRLPAKSLLSLRCILDDELSNCIDTLLFQRKHTFNLLNQPTSELLMVSDHGNIIYKIVPSPSSSSRQSPSIIETYDLNQLFEDIIPTQTTSINSRVIGASNGLICLYFRLYCIEQTYRRCFVSCNRSNCSGIRVCYPNAKCNRCKNSTFYRSKRIVIQEKTLNQHLILWNPCTEEYHMLPNTRRFHFDMFTDDNVHQTICGFGYDVANKTYKVVIGKGSVTQFYDISSNSWKAIDTFNITWSNRDEFGQFGEYLNSALHWIVSKTEIVAIDLSSTEVSNRLKLPNCCSTPKHSFHLGVLKGCLSLSCYKHGDEVNIWVMKEYGQLESWTNILVAKFDRDESEISPPLWVSKDEEMFLFLIDHMAYWYAKGEKLRYFKDDELDYISRGIVHVNTLVSPNPTFIEWTKKKKTTTTTTTKLLS